MGSSLSWPLPAPPVRSGIGIAPGRSLQLATLQTSVPRTAQRDSLSFRGSGRPTDVLTSRAGHEPRPGAATWERGGSRQYPRAPARACASSGSVPNGQRAVRTPAYRAAPGVSSVQSQSVPRGTRAVSTPSSCPRQALVPHRPSQYPTTQAQVIPCPATIDSMSLTD